MTLCRCILHRTLHNCHMNEIKTHKLQIRLCGDSSRRVVLPFACSYGSTKRYNIRNQSLAGIKSEQGLTHDL